MSTPFIWFYKMRHLAKVPGDAIVAHKLHDRVHGIAVYQQCSVHTLRVGLNVATTIALTVAAALFANQEYKETAHKAMRSIAYTALMFAPHT